MPPEELATKLNICQGAAEIVQTEIEKLLIGWEKIKENDVKHPN